jgi:hypothetical protein
MRRSEDSRSAIDRVDDGTPAIVAEARASFEALWYASKTLPDTVFCRGGLPDSDPPLQGAAPAKSLANELQVLRIGDYQRLRRH